MERSIETSVVGLKVVPYSKGALICNETITRKLNAAEEFSVVSDEQFAAFYAENVCLIVPADERSMLETTAYTFRKEKSNVL